MALRDEGKAVLEVGLNELATRQENPHVPYGPGEVAADIVACVRAGATLVHFHARDEAGAQIWYDAEPSRSVLNRAAQEVDLLAYPSYIERLDHVWELAAAAPPDYRLVLSPFDPKQHVKSPSWDESARRFEVIRFHGTESDDGYPAVVHEFERRGMVPNVAIFDSSDLRWVVCAARAGILRAPLNLKIFFSDRWLGMFEPSVEALDFVLSRLPADLDHETVIVPYAMTSRDRTETLLRRALERGHGIRVGIGDNARAFPEATNAGLVAWAAGLMAQYGCRPASAADLRRRCGMHARAAA
ncbi:MAG: 3-keto-5-aminohexanoate cleavage protein [Gammaproteobacteria bacterium]